MKMQACVKMHTTVIQKMTLLDVFMNVFTSFFHEMLFLCLHVVGTIHGANFVPAEVQRNSTAFKSCTKMERNVASVVSKLA